MYLCTNDHHDTNVQMIIMITLSNDYVSNAYQIIMITFICTKFMLQMSLMY